MLKHPLLILSYVLAVLLCVYALAWTNPYVLAMGFALFLGSSVAESELADQEEA